MASDASSRAFWTAVGLITAGVAGFLVFQLHAWPPHEDETLALFIGRQPLGEMMHTVLTVRGGAPLHFLLVHAAAELSPTLTALRAISTIFAIASIPVVALLAARLVGRRTALVATALVAASWVTLFHGVYGRMYSLFLFTSALSFLLLLRASDSGRWRDWTFWALATLAAISSHQYGAFVLVISAAYLLVARARRPVELLRPGIAAAVVVLAAIPMWRSTLVLANRFDVGVGGEERQLGGPVRALEYLRSSLGDFVAGWTELFVVIALLAAAGLVLLARRRPLSAVLVGLVFLVPAVGLTFAGAGGAANAPETRHLIFALPFFAAILAVGLVRVAALAGQRASAVLALAVAGLVAAELAWGWSTTPTLYAGEPERRAVARQEAAEWLAATSRPDDVLFGYDPLFLGARELGAPIGDVVIPRADATLAAEALVDAPKPLGRGVWVIDLSDGSRTVSNWSWQLEIPDRSPGPEFETRTFGPFLVVRSLEPTGSPRRFLTDTVRVQREWWDPLRGGIPNAGINMSTASRAFSQLRSEPAAGAQGG